MMQTRKSIFDEDDDLLSLLDTKPQTGEKPKRSTNFEDLFGPKSTPVSKEKSNWLGITDDEQFKNSASTKEALKNESTAKNTNTSDYTYNPKEPRRRRIGSAIQNDPLGLLSTSEFKVKYFKVRDTLREGL